MDNKKVTGIISNHHVREHKRHGVVSLKVVNQHAATANLRGIENHICHTITPKGSIIYGASNFNPVAIQEAIVASDSGYQLLPPDSFTLLDNRAHKVLVSYCNGWHVIPFPEVFSRHSGTCLVLGDRQNTFPPFHIKTGDCFRLGSVGLVVSEMRGEDDEVQKLDARTLEFLKDEALAFEGKGDIALSATEEAEGLLKAERGGDNDSQEELNSPMPCPSYRKTFTGSGPSRVGSGGINPGERFVCYMCYENHDTEDDALVAPCDCRGDTRYLHVQCLQKWYQSTLNGQQAQVIRTTGSGSPACKICGGAYKTGFRKASGKVSSILEIDKPGPYLCLVVVTKHDTNPGLFNTKFRLNFQSAADHQASFFNNPDDMSYNSIVIGRSSVCNMVLDYRTVSTIHAKITYEDGKFYLKDRLSSNGTMVYLRDPFPLSYSCAVKLRMGRSTISLQAKRNWSSAVRNMFGPSLPATGPHAPSPEVIQRILLDCMTDASKASTAHHSPILSNMQASSSNTILSSFRTFNDNVIDNDSIMNNNNNNNNNNNSYQDNNIDGPAASTAFVTLSNRRTSSIHATPTTINSFATSSSNRASSSASFHATQLVSMHSGGGFLPAPGEAAAGAPYFHESDNYRYNRSSAHVIHALSDKISEQLMDLEEVLAERHNRCVSSSVQNIINSNNIITSKSTTHHQCSDELFDLNHGSLDDKDADDATHHSCMHVTNEQDQCDQMGVGDSRETTLLYMKEDDSFYGSKGEGKSEEEEEDVYRGNNNNSSSAFHLSINPEHLSPGHVLRSQSASPSRNSQSNTVLPLLPSPVSVTMNDDIATGSCCSLKVEQDVYMMHLPSSSLPSSPSSLPSPSSQSRVSDGNSSFKACNGSNDAEDLLYTSFPTAGAFTVYGQQHRNSHNYSHATKTSTDGDS